MKKSFYQIKKIEFEFSALLFVVGICIFIFFWTSCGPSQEEIRARKELDEKANMRTVSVKTSDCECSNETLTYYDINGCEYVGRISRDDWAIMSHSGQCKRCENRQIYLTDSIVKANLKQFFTIKQQ